MLGANGQASEFGVKCITTGPRRGSDFCVLSYIHGDAATRLISDLDEAIRLPLRTDQLRHRDGLDLLFETVFFVVQKHC